MLSMTKKYLARISGGTYQLLLNKYNINLKTRLLDYIKNYNLSQMNRNQIL